MWGGGLSCSTLCKPMRWLVSLKLSTAHLRPYLYWASCLPCSRLLNDNSKLKSHDFTLWQLQKIIDTGSRPSVVFFKLSFMNPNVVLIHSDGKNVWVDLGQYVRIWYVIINMFIQGLEEICLSPTYLFRTGDLWCDRSAW